MAMAKKRETCWSSRWKITGMRRGRCGASIGVGLGLHGICRSRRSGLENRGGLLRFLAFLQVLDEFWHVRGWRDQDQVSGAFAPDRHGPMPARPARVPGRLHSCKCPRAKAVEV